MRKSKFIISFMVLIVLLLSSMVCAHSVELDPNSLITMPMWITNGSGNITIKTETNYSLYYQAVEISNTIFSQMNKTKSDGEAEAETLKEEYGVLKEEYQALETVYDEAADAYQEGINNGLSEEELNNLKTAAETAYTNYKNKVDEYNAKIDEYNDKVTEVNSAITELIPTYVETNWVETTDNKIYVDSSQFSGDKAYAIWIKLVTSDGSTYYDEGTYTISGTKAEDVSVKSISLNKTKVSITKGDTYTLKATVTPSDATDKTVTWSSDNEKVATVKNGVVTGVAEGTATITATTKDGEHTAKCTVTVTKKSTNNAGTTNSDKNTTTEEKDNTTTNVKLPNTGKIGIITLALVSLTIVSIIAYKKYRYLNF